MMLLNVGNFFNDTSYDTTHKPPEFNSITFLLAPQEFLFIHLNWLSTGTKLILLNCVGLKVTLKSGAFKLLIS